MQTSTQNQSKNSAHKQSTPQSKLLEIKRELNVPVDQLFQAFSTSSALKKWWWPKDIYTDRVDYDFREGGKYFINMKGFEDGTGGMTGQFEEIVPKKRIVMSDSFANQNGKAISAKEAKMPGAWPEMVYITFDFESIDENTSRVILSQQGIPNDAQADCIQGWQQMFDKLEAYLNQNKN